MKGTIKAYSAGVGKGPLFLPRQLPQFRAFQEAEKYLHYKPPPEARLLYLLPFKHIQMNQSLERISNINIKFPNIQILLTLNSTLILVPGYLIFLRA